MKRIGRAIKRRLLEIIVTVMVLLVIGLALAPSVLQIVRSGEAGVLYRTLTDGTQTEREAIYGEGLHIILPWDKFYIYDVRIQEKNTIIHVLTKDGLSVDVEISVRFHPNVTTLGLLHKYIGPDYVEKVISPEVEATVRDVIGMQDVDALYSEKRTEIQQEISDRCLKAINDLNSVSNYEVAEPDSTSVDFEHSRTAEYIIFEDLFIRDIMLPKMVSKKIEEKIMAEQELKRYEYLLASETEEQKRKLIEAKGIRFFEDSSGISILKWRGLQATEALSNSPNSKLILIGTDENLPIILNGETSDRAPNDPQPTNPLPAAGGGN
jgi:prohibitin 2